MYILQASKILEPVTSPFCNLSVWLVQGIICLNLWNFLDHAVDGACCCCCLYENGSDSKADCTVGGSLCRKYSMRDWGILACFSLPIPNALQSPVIRQSLVHTQLAGGQLCVKYALPLMHRCRASQKYIKVHCWACTGQPCDMENKHCAGTGGKSWQSAITLQGGNKASFVCAMSWCYLQQRTAWSPTLHSLPMKAIL